jgi:PAS domain S-box-containing protein
MFRVFTCLTEQHDWRLVLLAGFVSFLSSLVAISLFRRAQASRGRVRAAWIATAGVAAGSGIWAAHFIAILAYEPGIPITFQVGLTAFSLAASIGITGAGLSAGVYGRPAWRAPAAGGIIGLGIAFMHYTGMRALDVPGHAAWSIDLVVISILAGMVFSMAALVVVNAGQGTRATLLAASLLTLAIVAHHFTAMGAMAFVPDPALTATGFAVPPMILAPTIAGVTMLVLGVAFALAVMDQLLADRSSLLDSALQNVVQGITMFDAAGRLLVVNNRYREMYGLSADVAKPGAAMRDLLAQRLAVGTFAGDPDRYAAKFIGGAWEAVREARFADGRIILINISPRPDGGWVATHNDITKLKQQESSFRLMFESNPIPMWVTERDTLRFLDVNVAAVEHYGYSRERFLEMTLSDIRPAEDRNDLRAALARADTNIPGRIRHHQKANGTNIEVSIYTRPLIFTERDAVLVASIDVTVRKMVEDELRRTRAFLDTVIESVPAVVVVREAKIDGRYVLINRACEEFLGLTRDKVIGRTIYEILPPQAAELIAARDAELLEQGHAIFDTENLLSTVDHGDRYMTAQRLVMRDDHGRPKYLLTVIDDVTERRLARDKLLEANEMMRAVIDASPVAICGSVPSGALIIWNQAAEDLFGYTAEEAIGRPVSELIVPDDLRESFSESRPKIFSGACFRNLVERRKRKDGSIIDVLLAGAPVFAADGSVRAIVVAVEDITKRKMLEEQLRQSQKMEAIGQLTGGLSHDFNNLLAIIIGNLDLLRERVSGDPDATEAVEEALGASLRGADLNRRLLAFARRQPLQPKIVDLNELVAGLTKLLERTLGEHISITLSLADGLWPLVVDPAQLEAALTNLVVNARDAMPRGGGLTIGTRNISIDRDYADMHADVTAGDYVVLEVSDTGTGMPPDVLARVFEPFFTTKDKDKGTGLGLSMVFGFVKQSGGHVEVYSEVGIGTTLRLYLSRAANAAAEPKPDAPALLPRGHETVLAVEDNPNLRRILIRQLADLGYRVLEAENAQSAMEILKREPQVDLLFTDIVLPGGMNGAELARMAEKMRGGLKVLFTSGFPETAFGPDGALPPGARLLGKPYHKDELAQRLRESLAA